jgi:hypothetical protein
VYSKFELQLQITNFKSSKQLPQKQEDGGEREEGAQSVQNLKCGPKTFQNSQTKLVPTIF